MKRVYNFSPGPAALPEEVLAQARDELLDWQGTGMSVMEVSHRGKEFSALAEEAEADVRELLQVPDSHKVLFVQGGATLQFSAVPLNLASTDSLVSYVNSGSWSKKAIAEAEKYCRVEIAADAAPFNYHKIPPQDTWNVDSRAAYLHYTPNETIGGVEFHFIPETGGVPLVADMSSTILSRPVEVGRFGVIYAGAQKNIGPAGLTLVIVHEDLLDRARPHTPTVIRYKTMADTGSMSNTPPTFAWYVAGLVFKWLKRQGGLAAMAERNRAKADKLYRAIDGSGFYSNPVDPSCRSWMNVPFTLADPGLDARFLEEAASRGLKNLKGHRSVGGMRASLYNAVPEAAVDALVEFMQWFEQNRG